MLLDSTELHHFAAGEPTSAALDAIEAEWPVIAAELDVLDAEIRLALSPDVLAVRAHRRAVRTLADTVRAATASHSHAHPSNAA